MGVPSPSSPPRTGEEDAPEVENQQKMPTTPNGLAEHPTMAPPAAKSLPKQHFSIRSFFSGLSARQWLTFGVLYLANLCAAMTFSCIIPFFPTEAKKKGLSTAQTGLIIGAFQLTMFVASPVFGKFIARIGANRMFSGGLICCALGTMLYGLLIFFPSGTAFFIAVMAFRCACAFGNAAFRTSSLTLIAKQFPAHVSSVVGLTQTSMAIGYAVGPTIGSGLYEWGGFSLPFLVLGSLILLPAVVSILLFFLFVDRNQKQQQQKEEAIMGKNKEATANGEGKAKKGKEGKQQKQKQQNVGITTVLLVPEVALTLTSLIALELSLCFYDAAITEHLQTLSSHASLLTGLLLSLTSLVCMFTGPVVGILTDRLNCFQQLMVTGTVSALVFPLLMGPAPFLAPLLSLSIPALCVCFALQGLSIICLNTPSFKFCLKGAKRKGLLDEHDANNSTATGCISGLLNGAIALGAFIGVSGGGLSIQLIGFEPTSAVAGTIHVLPLAIQLWLYCRAKHNKDRQERSRGKEMNGIEMMMENIENQGIK